VTQAWLCRRCRAHLDMHLDHVGCGVKGASCTGTWQHPRNRCILSGRTVRHVDALLSDVIDGRR
jgi:hypothetical protein